MLKIFEARLSPPGSLHTGTRSQLATRAAHLLCPKASCITVHMEASRTKNEEIALKKTDEM
jgi:hypothetical protein